MAVLGGDVATWRGWSGRTEVRCRRAATLTAETRGRLVNPATRAAVGRDGALLAALVPGLAEFGGAGTLADAVMTVLRGSEEVARNDNGGEQGAPVIGASVAQVRTTMAAVGAFGLKEGRRDAVLLLDLRPGSYTVQVAGVAGATGVALGEVYEVGS